MELPLPDHPIHFTMQAFKQLTFRQTAPVKLNPVTSYFDAAECNYCESFDGAGFSMTATATK
jgi:hypothetical protein